MQRLSYFGEFSRLGARLVPRAFNYIIVYMPEAKGLKEVETKLLNELMGNCRRSDRELVKSVGVSQPTVARMIKKIQKDYGLAFATSVDLSKAGFEVLALTFGKKEERPMETQKIQEFLKEYRDSIIFASTGIGSRVNADRMVISVHKTYSDYVRFINYLKTAWTGLVLVGDSFLVSPNSDKVIRPLSLQSLFETAEE